MNPAFRLAAIVAALFAATALAQTTRPRLSPEQQMRYRELNADLQRHFTDRDYERALEVGRKLVELFPSDAPSHYNVGCALARLGKKEDALAALARSVEAGYADAAHMKADEDLATLREEPAFADLLRRARDNELNAPYEKGAEIKGIRSIEGLPEGGLRYRLRISQKASKDKPHRLVIWLHPSGGSMNAQVEALAPKLAEAGYALLVLTRKNWAGWSEDQAKMLLDKTLPEVAKTDGLDADRPLLMGFSAGGQLALLLWKKDPAKFGGLILDAAYPVDQTPRGLVPLDPPAGDAARKTPILVLVGENDGGGQFWKAAAGRWIRAGVPLRIQYVPNAGHEWLFGARQVEDLLDWLGQVREGKTPADEPPTTLPVAQRE